MFVVVATVVANQPLGHAALEHRERRPPIELGHAPRAFAKWLGFARVVVPGLARVETNMSCVCAWRYIRRVSLANHIQR